VIAGVSLYPSSIEISTIVLVFTAGGKDNNRYFRKYASPAIFQYGL